MIRITKGKFWRKYICKMYIIARCKEKYIDVYNLVLIFWKTFKGTNSNHTRQIKWEKENQKRQKFPNFCYIWNIKAYFEKTFCLKYMKE